MKTKEIEEKLLRELEKNKIEKKTELELYQKIHDLLNKNNKVVCDEYSLLVKSINKQRAEAKLKQHKQTSKAKDDELKEKVEELETRLFGYVFDSSIKSQKQIEEEVYEAINKIFKGEENEKTK